MKAQMKFQKILSLLTLIVGALVFVYALCFFSGNLSNLMYYKLEDIGDKYYDYTELSDNFIYNGQSFVSLMVAFGIVYICVAAVIYITATNKRRNYYITNYVAIGLALAVSAVVGILLIAYVGMLMGQFYDIGIDMSNTENDIGYMYNALKDKGAPTVSNSPTMFVLGFIMALIVLANCVAWVLNLIWKIKLMKGEKALLESGLVKEVA